MTLCYYPAFLFVIQELIFYNSKVAYYLPVTEIIAPPAAKSTSDE